MICTNRWIGTNAYQWADTISQSTPILIKLPLIIALVKNL